MNCKKCIHSKVCKLNNNDKCDFYRSEEQIAEVITDILDTQRKILLNLNGLKVKNLTKKQWVEAKKETLKWIKEIL